MNRIYCRDVENFVTDEQLEKIEYLHLMYDEISFMSSSKRENITYKYDELEKELGNIIEELSISGIHDVFLEELSQINIDEDWKKSYERQIKLNIILDEEEKS